MAQVDFKTPAVPRLTKREIADKAEVLTGEYIRQMDWKQPEDMMLNIDELYESTIYPAYELKFRKGIDLGGEDDSKVLGKWITDENTALIDRSISPPNRDARYAFTIGHEFGHGVLHSEQRTLFRDTSATVFGGKAHGPLEVEANLFATHLLMPGWLVRQQFQNCYRPNRPVAYLGPGRYTLDAFGYCHPRTVRTLDEFCRAMARPLQIFFYGVSKQSLGIRLLNLGLVRNANPEGAAAVFDPVTKHGSWSRPARA